MSGAAGGDIGVLAVSNESEGEKRFCGRLCSTHSSGGYRGCGGGEEISAIEHARPHHVRPHPIIKSDNSLTSDLWSGM